MIDFRYHLISIVAIFLALAIGIVLGTTTLRGPVISELNSATNRLSAENEQLRHTVRNLQQQSSGTSQLLRQVSPQLVEGVLAGERVAIVQAPGASGAMREATAKMLRKAGASVTGRVSMTDKYLADGELTVIDELARRLKPKGMRLPGGTPHDRAAAVLATALVTQSQGNLGKASNAGKAILSGFETAGYISTSGEPTKRASLAVVVAPSQPFEGSGVGADNNAIVALARELDERGRGAVAIGPTSAATQGGVIAALRANNSVASKVSSVDAAHIPAGRVVTVYALARQAAGDVGQFGTGPGAERFLPKRLPVAEASPTKSAEPEPTRSAEQGK